MHVRAFSFLGLCARNSLTFAALRSGDGLGPRCQYYRSPSLATALEPPNFNHALVRGAIGAIQYVAGYVTKFQSTHPRGVRHIASDDTVQIERVSIHAPAWGATPASVEAGRNELFQSTHPRGVRRWYGVGDWLRLRVSIHAPAWGATFVGAPVLALLAGFNPRTRVGCDECKRQFSVVPKMFQSTHPRGVRLNKNLHIFNHFLFQSTHPRGVRLYHRAAREHYVEFQSTHPRGVRLGA